MKEGDTETREHYLFGSNSFEGDAAVLSGDFPSTLPFLAALSWDTGDFNVHSEQLYIGL